MRQAVGAASDVHGLLLGRQQSVHGSRHRLHVNLRAEADASRGGGSGAQGLGRAVPPTMGGCEDTSQNRC